MPFPFLLFSVIDIPTPICFKYAKLSHHILFKPIARFPGRCILLSKQISSPSSLIDRCKSASVDIAIFKYDAHKSTYILQCNKSSTTCMHYLLTTNAQTHMHHTLLSPPVLSAKT